jgi:cytochrome P450
MIDERRGGSATDLVTVFSQQQDEAGERLLSDAEVRDEVLGMIIGGHETSSVALTWVWYELARNPQVEQRLHDELDRVLGDRPLSLADIEQLTYTRMVIDETLRLHPPFWFENRNVVRDVELGGVRLPAGTMVLFSRHALHRHPDFWADPQRFDPQRFAPGEEENARSTHAYVPFGGGPRVCVGVHFALQELVVLVASLARRFRLEVDPSDRGEASALLTMRLKHGLKVRVTPRQHGSRARAQETINPVDRLERK